MLIAIEQIVENERVDALGIRVNPHARIEICRATLNDHHNRVGVGRLRAGEKGQHKRAK